MTARAWLALALRESRDEYGVDLPEDLYVCVEKPSIPLAQEVMAICDLTIATGGPTMAKSAHQSGKPAYAAGQGNSTMVIDETADIEEAARNSMLSKTSDFGSGCSADGNLLVMHGPTQAHWKHGIRRTAKPCGPRINLTFRQIVHV